MARAPAATITGKAAKARFWNEITETMKRDKLDALHLDKLQKLVHYVYEYSPFYRGKFDEAGLFDYGRVRVESSDPVAVGAGAENGTQADV